MVAGDEPRVLGSDRRRGETGRELGACIRSRHCHTIYAGRRQDSSVCCRWVGAVPALGATHLAGARGQQWSSSSKQDPIFPPPAFFSPLAAKGISAT